MRRTKWKKRMVLTMAAGLLCGQLGTMPVWAEELPEAETMTEATIEISEESVAEPGTEEGASEEETVELETGLDDTEGELAAEAMELSDIRIGAETAYPDQEEDIELLVGAASGSANKLTWREEGDTLIITGKGSSSHPDWGMLQNVRSVRFENCKITGSMRNFFGGADNLMNIDVSGLDTSQVTDMGYMFDNCSSLTSLDVSGLDTSSVTNMRYMFASCSSLTSLNVSGFDTSNVTDMYGMFENCSSLTSLGVSGFDTSSVTDMEYMFDDCSSLTSLDVSGFDTSSVTDMRFMFYGCSSLTRLDVSNFKTSKVTDMGGMFGGCSNLISIDVSGFDTSNVSGYEYFSGQRGGMDSMFSGCSGLTSLDVSGFDTSSVADMHLMFSGCSGLTSLDVSGFDTSSVVDMGGMFDGCSSLTSLDVSGFDTSSVKGFFAQNNMNCMFAGCSSLTSLDLSSFDTSGVTDIDGMFRGCSSLTSVNLSSFDTSWVSSMNDMFNGCNSLTSLDLSGFDAGFVTEGIWRMFDDCRNLTIINSPRNLHRYAALPEIENEKWYLPDGTFVATLPVELDYSVTLTRRSMSPVPTQTPALDIPNQDKSSVNGFVSRMYTVALNRDAEEEGLNYWTNRLLTHEVDGAGIAYGFIMSDEFQNRNLGDGEFVDVLYRTFFNREAEEGGRSFWLSKLASGRTRGYVLSGFVNSVEFDDLCDSFGIARGTMKEDGNPYNPGIRQFVERQYTKVLNRQGERDGINYWMEEIISGRHMAEDVAKMFFQSEEFSNRNLNDADYVETLYETFLGRASETDGKNYWLQQINDGMNRNTVLEGFSKSVEFAEILAGYGL